MKKLFTTIRSKIARSKYTLLCKLAKEQIDDARIDAYEDGFNAGVSAVLNERDNNMNNNNENREVRKKEIENLVDELYTNPETRKMMNDLGKGEDDVLEDKQ